MGFFSRKKKGKAAQCATATTDSPDSSGPATTSKLAVAVLKSKQQKPPAAKPQNQQHAPPKTAEPSNELQRQQQQQQQQQEEQAVKPPPTPHHHHQQQKQQQQPTEPNATTVTNISQGDPAYATPDVTRDLVKKFISDIWNRCELELIPQVCSPKIRFNGNNGLDKIGHDGFARMVATIHAALSDYHCEIHSMVVEDNKAFCRLRFSGKHTGNLLGYQPTGRIVSWMGATEFTCLNGRILKVWELGDMKTLEEQLQCA